MVCEVNETDVDIRIPAVMIPQDAGASLVQSIKNNSHGKITLHGLTLSKMKNNSIFLFF